MRTYTHHHEIRTLLAQVLNAFEGIILYRYDETDNSTITDTIKLNITYAPKQRIIYDLVNKSQHIKLPCMAVTMSNLRYDNKRAFNKIEGFTANMGSHSAGKYPQPIPIQLTINTSFLCRYQRDAHQYITNLLAYFFPYIIISYKHPDLDQEVRCVVEWDQNTTLTYPTDIAANTAYRISVDTTFVVSGWIFRNADNPVGIIHNIPISFTSVSAIFAGYDYLHSQESDSMDNYRTDYLTVSGRPLLLRPDREILFTNAFNVGTPNTEYLMIDGDMLQHVKHVALVPVAGSSFPFAATNMISPLSGQTETIFSGCSAEWTPHTSTSFQITLPQIIDDGRFDVIAYGDIGLGQLSVDAFRPNGTFQWPWVSGIEVVDV